MHQKKTKMTFKELHKYRKAMRLMIQRVHSGEQVVAIGADPWDLEILADCIRYGFINGSLDVEDGANRTMDGTVYPRVFNSIIPLKGLEFLYPPTDWKFVIPTIISLIALLFSLCTLGIDLLTLLQPQG